MISYSERVIQDHQLTVQEEALDVELLRSKLELNVYSADSAWRLQDELNLLKRSVQIARQDLHEIPVAKRTLWDRLRIRLYMWSVGGRF